MTTEDGPDTTQKFDKDGNPNFGPRKWRVEYVDVPDFGVKPWDVTNDEITLSTDEEKDANWLCDLLNREEKAAK